jgi:hypothetical protein
MAWVTMIGKGGTKITIPKPVYENMYMWNEAYSLLEPEPIPDIEELHEEVVENEPIQESNIDENKVVRKSTKKTVS